MKNVELKKNIKKISPLLSLLCAFILLLTTNAWAWPNDTDWHAIFRGENQLEDPQNDATGNDARDIVGNASNSAAYIFKDDNFIYFRIRVDQDPRKNSSGALEPFGWGFLAETDQNPDDYEFMIMLDGISNPDIMYLAQNTIQGTLGDASDKAELILWQENLNYNSNYRVIIATDKLPPFGGDDDYFIDWLIPFDIYQNSLGLTDSSTIRYFVGSANNAMVLNADLVGADLYDSSNPVLPPGIQPTTGIVTFVQNSDGSGDLNNFYAGETIYLKVEDIDLNTTKSEVEMVTVQVVTPGGDTETTVTLTETGPDTGIFVGPLLTTDATATSNDGILQTDPIEIISVTYNDVADGTEPTPLTNQPRTDTCMVLPVADITVSKTVDNSTPNEGEPIIYNVTVSNDGPSDASGVQVTDLLPGGVTYSASMAPAGTSYNQANGLWLAGNLASGQSKILVIDAIVDTGTAGQTITNTATKTAAAQLDPVETNDSSTVSISVAGADLQVSKSVDNSTPLFGATVNFTISVTNSGDSEATSVELTDILPTATWSAVSVTEIDQGSWSYTSGNGTWLIGTLSGSATKTIHLQAILDESIPTGTTVTNTASITHADQADPNPANNSDSAQLTVGGIDLDLTKVVTTPSTADPNVGDTVTFTVTVTNNSTSTTATGIQVIDSLPNGLSYSSDTSQGNYASGSGIWIVGDLAPKASATLDLYSIVDAGTSGQTLVNQATIDETSYNETDIDTRNHSATASVTIRAADLLVEKTVDNPNPSFNSGALSYTITVTNLSNEAVNSVEIFDELPGQVTYVSATPSEGTYSTVTHLWSGIDLGVAESAALTINVTYNLKKTDPKIFFNTASLTASTPEDNNASNNSSTTTVSINGADLSISKEINSGYSNNPASGTTTQFLLTLSNLGPTTATGIVVKDVLPPQFSCDSGTASNGSFATNKCEWSLNSLTVGTSETLVLTSTVSAASGTVANNQVSITAADQPDPNSGNNFANKTVYVGGSDLALRKTVDNEIPNKAETIKFTITLTNNGTNSVDAIEVTDLIPLGLTLVPAATATSQGSYDSATGIWTVGTINYTGNSAVDNVTLELYTKVDSGTSGTTITNNASITAAGSIDPDISNNSATQDITVQQADVYVSKSVDTLTPPVNSNVTFTIVTGNNGPHTATSVIVSDLLPAGLAYVSHIAETGAYDSIDGTWSVDSIAKGTPSTLTITAQVTGTSGVNITNTASKLSADQYDPNPLNNGQSVVLTPSAVPILTVLKSADKAAVNPGEVITYTVIITNTGSSATNVLVDDNMSSYTAWSLDSFGSGIPFYLTQMATGTPVDSGVTLGTPTYYDASGAVITPISDGGGAGVDYDGTVKRFELPMNGTMVPNGQFQLQYKVKVK